MIGIYDRLGLAFVGHSSKTGKYEEKQPQCEGAGVARLLLSLGAGDASSRTLTWFIGAGEVVT